MNDLLSKIEDKLEFEEGFESRMYKCPADKWTIGFGFNLETTPIPKEVARLWLSHLIENIRFQLGNYDWYRGLDEDRQVVIIDMAYQIGISGLFKFRKMIRAIEEKDYNKAADELMDSRYARQTPSRAVRNYKAMRGEK